MSYPVSELQQYISLLNKHSTTQEIEFATQVIADQQKRGPPSEKAETDMATALITSANIDEIKFGIKHLQMLYERTTDDELRRRYLLLSAVGLRNLDDLQAAMNMCDTVLSVRPSDRVAHELRTRFQSEMRHKGLLGAAYVGGAVLASTSLVALAAIGIAKLIGRK